MRRPLVVKGTGVAIMIVTTLTSCKQARYGVLKPGVATAGEPEPATPAQDKEINNTPEGVIFGTTGVFHLGDASFGGSTCKSQLVALPLNGSKFNFMFTVTSDNTPVTISVSDLCGVDLDNNMVSIESTHLVQPPIPIQVNATSMDLPPLTLSAGSYKLTITSGKNVNNPNFLIGNYDDFIVGHVQIRGNNIQGVSYSAEP